MCIREFKRVEIPISFINVANKNNKKIVIDNDIHRIFDLDVPENSIFFIDENAYNIVSEFKDILHGKQLYIQKFDNNTLYDVADVCKIFSELGIQKNSPICIIGSKIFIDIFGFASSIYLSGLETYLIPTTLFAMSETGGIYSVNASTSTKYDVTLNTFNSSIFICPAISTEYDKDSFANGLANILRYSLISNITLFNKLHNLIHFTEDKRQINLDQLADLLDDEVKTRMMIIAFESKHIAKAKLSFSTTFINHLDTCFGNKLSYIDKLTAGIKIAILVSLFYTPTALTNYQIVTLKTILRACNKRFDEVIESTELIDGLHHYFERNNIKNVKMLLVTKIGDQTTLCDVPVEVIERVIRNHEPFIY